MLTLNNKVPGKRQSWIANGLAVLFYVLYCGCSQPKATHTQERANSRAIVSKIPPEKLKTAEHVRMDVKTDPPKFLLNPVRMVINELPSKITIEANGKPSQGFVAKLVYRNGEKPTTIRNAMLDFKKRGTNGEYYAYIHVDEEWTDAISKAENRNMFFMVKTATSPAETILDIPIIVSDALLIPNSPKAN